jgi:hypothetical protein
VQIAWQLPEFSRWQKVIQVCENRLLTDAAQRHVRPSHTTPDGGRGDVNVAAEPVLSCGNGATSVIDQRVRPGELGVSANKNLEVKNS